MGSTTTTELGLDLNSSFALRTVNGLFSKAGTMVDGDSKFAKMEEYVRCLEEERRKIEAFKRELPLCMLILNDVIDCVKEELTQCRDEVGNKPPVLEQFLPIDTRYDEDGEEKLEKDSRDKMNWMSSAQLWSDNCSDSSTDTNSNNTGNNTKTKQRNGESTDQQSESGNTLAERKSKGRGAFLPFKGLSGVPEEKLIQKKVVASVSDLSLRTPGFKNSPTVSRVPEEHRSCGSSSQGKTIVCPSSNDQSNLQQQQQGPRKARRCWSPELHRRFLSALQQLGGSQAATPKQIRELMKVDGLTNDEVKSHLQKYRLHTRRISPSTCATDEAAVVLGGGLWMPSSSPDHYPASKPNNSQSGSPQGPLQLAMAASAAARRITVTDGDSCGEEDGRSESYSWKGHAQRCGEEDVDC